MDALKNNMLDAANGEQETSKLTSKPASYVGNIQNKQSFDSSKQTLDQVRVFDNKIQSSHESIFNASDKP